MDPRRPERPNDRSAQISREEVEKGVYSELRERTVARAHVEEGLFWRHRHYENTCLGK